MTKRETGRPVSSGSLTDSEGRVRAHLHVTRLRGLAQKYGGRDGALMAIAAEAIVLLSKHNRTLGRIAGNATKKRAMTNRGASFLAPAAAEAIAELAADGPVTAYVGRDPRRVRVIRNGRLPRAAKLIGTYDAGCDFRHVQEDIEATIGRAA